MKKIIALLLLLFSFPFGKGWNIHSQDFHVSQIDAAPHYFNPAVTGVFLEADVKYRIYSDYRTQWKSLGINPFATYYLAGDMPYKISGKEIGVGAYLIHNRNGKGGLNTMQFMPSLAYNITQGKDGPHNLSVGLQMGIIYKSFDPNSFTFDNQYTGASGYDKSLRSGENFSKTSLLRFDANMGVYYKYKNESWKAQPNIGFSVNHIPRPDQSLLGIEKDKLPLRWALQAGADWQVKDELKLTPMVFYMNQAKATELNIGALCFYKIKDKAYEVIGGLDYRVNDALVAQVGLKYGPHIFKFSTDINTSYLNNYTNGSGAFEFSLILNGIAGKSLFGK